MAKKITYEDFEKIDIRTGTIVEAYPNEGARKPAYVMEIDFGELGRKTSSAQITDNYTPDELRGKTIVAVVNFPPMRIAGVRSEVLVLGVMAERGVVLLHPDDPVGDGIRIG